MSDLKTELFSQIETELEFCDTVNTPLICSNMADPESKALLVRTIAETCLSRKIDISQAISEVEKAYGINDID